MLEEKKGGGQVKKQTFFIFDYLDEFVYAECKVQKPIPPIQAYPRP